MALKDFFRKNVYRIFHVGTSAPGASILMYHSVGKNDSSFTVSPEMFERQLRFLKREGYTVVKLSDLLGRIGKEDISRHVTLTFDDGYRDNYDVVLPLLEKYQVPATFFIATGTVDSERTTSTGTTIPMMDRKMLQTLGNDPLVEVAPHSVSHAKLDILPFDEAVQEIEDSRTELAEIAGSYARVFAFPSGRYTNELVEYLRKHERHWQGAVTVQPGLVRIDSDPYKLPRNAVHAGTSMAEFAGLLTTAVERYQALKRYV